ncbi:hypothetical protein AS029_16255 [Microbacterium enclense]|nr:hypothetical protein AS029_16255 [Microbacterium enclense]
MTARTRRGRKRKLGRIGRFLRFPWSLVLLIVAIAAFLVFMPVSIFGALAAAGGDWNTPGASGRFWTYATISQQALVGFTHSLILIVCEVGLIRMLPAQVRLWRARMSARGQDIVG